MEDNADNRILLMRILKSLYSDINIAQDGQEGVDLALKLQPDLILMDLQMPRMGGQEATQILREKGYEGVVIALTAHALKEEKDRCLKNGFNAYVTKPIDRKILFETISSFLSPQEA